MLTHSTRILPAVLAVLASVSFNALSATPATPSTSPGRQCIATEVDPPATVTLGKSTVISLPYSVARIAAGGHPAVSRPAASAAAAASRPEQDGAGGARMEAAPMPPTREDGVSEVSITLLGPRELFVLGKKAGAMNLILQGTDGRCHVKDIVVTVDPGALQGMLATLMPEEKHIKVHGAENALVLTGDVSDAVKLDQVLSLAGSYGDGKKVVNMLRLSSPQQVMLEVKIAEVSKTLLDRLGASVGVFRSRNGGGDTLSLISNFLSGGGGLLEVMRVGRTAVEVDGQKDDGLVRILAEPNIMAVSGQEASFLSGGRIFIPVAQSGAGGAPVITLEEKNFGIGVRFFPTVLDQGRVNLKLTSEVSDLTQTGSPFTSVNGVTSVLPSLTVRRADTTVQLRDGQSFVIAGLIRNDITETVKRFPGLGEVPALGALFRSTEFQNAQTELMFVVTPRLVKPLPQSPRLPTDNHVVPSRSDVYLNGSLEGADPSPASVPTM